MHFYANSSVSVVICHDGIQRNSWTFKSGYANTFLGRSFGRLMIAITYMKHRQNERADPLSVSKLVK
jgi:hypothetical protein